VLATAVAGGLAPEQRRYYSAGIAAGMTIEPVVIEPPHGASTVVLPGTLDATAVTPPSAPTRESVAEPLTPPYEPPLGSPDWFKSRDLDDNDGPPPLPPSTNTNEPPQPPLTEVVASSGGGMEFGAGLSVRVQAHHDPITASTAYIRIIERRLRERPDDIRDAAHSYAKAFKAYADELRRINDRSRQCDEFIDFLDQMAAGLADLADALERAFATPTPEPLLTREAAEKARVLADRVVDWVKWMGTDALDVPMIRIGVLCSGIGFLHYLGADSAAGVGALYWSIHRTGKQADH
jgi:hypothetical protein